MNKVIVVAIAFLLVLAISCGVNRSTTVVPAVTAEPSLPHSMKGYELYSWQVGGEWYFSLLEGTNRLKTYSEVTADTVAVKGIESMMRKLERLPKYEQVFWNIQNLPNLTMPPEETINQIKEYCVKSGIDLTVVE